MGRAAKNISHLAQKIVGPFHHLYVTTNLALQCYSLMSKALIKTPLNIDALLYWSAPKINAFFNGATKKSPRFSPEGFL
jgi:hypothetical protein